MAAEFFGNCQICGNEHKCSASSIAKHGYTIRSGWQEGACYGSGGKPIQVSCDLITGALAAAKEYIERTESHIAKLVVDPLHDRGAIGMLVRTPTRTGDVYRIERVTLELGEKGLPVAVDVARKVLKSWPFYSGVKTVDEAALELATSRISFLRRTIVDAGANIVYLTDRLANWQPSDLRPVSAEERAAEGPRLHFASKKFGRETGACAKSARSAQTWRQTTSDRSLVTCVACLKELARIDDLPLEIAAAKAKDHMRKVKSLETNIREYQKLLKRDRADLEAVTMWTEALTRATGDLEKLISARPGQ
jgi:hypothetical protein